MALDPAYLSARKDKPKLHVPVLAVVDGVEERLPDLIPVLGMNLLKCLGPYELLALSEQPAVGGVDVNPPALEVDQDDQIGSVLRDHAEAFFGFAKIFRHLRGEVQRAAARGGQRVEDSEKEQAREQTAGQEHRGEQPVEAPYRRVLGDAEIDFPYPAGDFHRQHMSENGVR